MKLRSLHIFVIIYLPVLTATAQQRLNVELDRQPIVILFERIENLTGSRIYSADKDVDTLKISVRAVNQEPLDILKEALKNTPYKASKFRNDFFILKDKELVTFLPDNFFFFDEYREETVEIAPEELTLYSDENLDAGFDETIYSIDEVVVLGSKEDNIKSTIIGVEYLKMKNIKNIPTAFGEKDILRVVLMLPGVKSAGEISSGFNVRGGATDQNLILYNGNIIYNPTHLFGMFSAFNPDMISDMELYKSSIPVKYGGRISSVLVVNSREGNLEEFRASGSLGLLTSRLTVEGPLFRKKGSYILGGRTTYSDWLLKKLPEKSGYNNGRAGFYDLNATFAYTPNEKNKLSLNAYFSNDRFAFNEYSLKDFGFLKAVSGEKYAYKNANVSAKWRHVFGPKLFNILTVGYDHYDYNMSDDFHFSAYTLNYKIDQGFLKYDASWFPSTRHSLNFGFSSILYDFSPGEYFPKGAYSMVMEDRMQHEKALESAVYIGDDWEITPRLSVNAGIRYAMFNAMGYRDYNVYMPEYLPSMLTQVTTESAHGIFKTWHGPEYRFSSRYLFSNQLSVKLGVNTMQQFIHKISNTTVMSPTDTWKLCDVNIRPQTGIQIVGGIFKNFSEIETSIEAYYKTMNHYLDYRQGAQLVMNHHIETDVLPTKGKSYGVELMIKKTTGKLNGWMSYTYSRTMLRQADKRINMPANNGNWYPADFDKPHEIKFTGNYKITQRYSFSLNLDYSTGRPITLPAAKYRYAGGQLVYYTYRNQYRIPDYFRIDLSFNIEPSHHLILLTHSSFSFGIYNLTGRRNAHSVYFVSEGGRIKGYKMSIFGTLVPFISYNIKI